MPETPRPSVLLAIPAYNCAPQIVRVLDALDDSLLARVAQVLVIDNRSTDGTDTAAAAAGRRIGAKFEAWRNEQNYGLGGSHKVAFDRGLHGGFDYVAILHGDDQATPAQLHRLLDRATAEPGADAILGSRFSRGSVRRGYSLTRTLGNRAINALYTIVTLRRTVDLGSGLNLFATRSLQDRFYCTLDDRITFNIDLLLAYYSRRSRLLYEPITWTEADQVSNARNLAVGTTAVRRLLAWRLGRSVPPSARPAYTGEVFA